MLIRNSLMFTTMAIKTINRQKPTKTSVDLCKRTIQLLKEQTLKFRTFLHLVWSESVDEFVTFSSRFSFLSSDGKYSSLTLLARLPGSQMLIYLASFIQHSILDKLAMTSGLCVVSNFHILFIYVYIFYSVFSF